MPGAAQAAPLLHAGRPAAVSFSTSSICNKVSPSAVSRIVGYTVPAPTEYTSTYVVDKALNLSATSTDCGFTVTGSITSPFSTKTVYLDSEVFTKSVTLATLKKVEAAEQEKVASQEKASHFKVSYSDYSGLGVTAVYYKITATIGLPTGVTLPKGVSLPKGFSLSFAYSGIATLEGKQSYAASVNNGTIPESKLAALVGLAMKL